MNYYDILEIVCVFLMLFLVKNIYRLCLSCYVFCFFWYQKENVESYSTMAPSPERFIKFHQTVYRASQSLYRCLILLNTCPVVAVLSAGCPPRGFVEASLGQRSICCFCEYQSLLPLNMNSRHKHLSKALRFTNHAWFTQDEWWSSFVDWKKKAHLLSLHKQANWRCIHCKV